MSEAATSEDLSELDRMQSAYKAAVEEWIAAIKQEEDLASVNHSVAEVDKWEAAHFKEDEIRTQIRTGKGLMPPMPQLTDEQVTAVIELIERHPVNIAIRKLDVEEIGTHRGPPNEG